MEKISFIHKVSKGTRFNQIYIPKEMQLEFLPGYDVEVTLIPQKDKIYYCENLKDTGILSDFKKNLIKEMLKELNNFKEINQVFIIGSFLTQKQDYNDIDIILITNKKEDFEKEVYNTLLEKFEMKFHLLSINQDKFKQIQEYDPIMRSMLYYFVSNKPFKLSKKTQINKEHLKFLLMMPEDLLKIDLNSRVYYDCLRRLISIENFLEKEQIDPINIEEDIKKILNIEILKDIKKDKEISKEIRNKIRNKIKKSLEKINKKLDKIKR